MLNQMAQHLESRCVLPSVPMVPGGNTRLKPRIKIANKQRRVNRIACTGRTGHRHRSLGSSHSWCTTLSAGTTTATTTAPMTKIRRQKSGCTSSAMMYRYALSIAWHPAHHTLRLILCDLWLVRHVSVFRVVSGTMALDSLLSVLGIVPQVYRAVPASGTQMTTSPPHFFSKWRKPWIWEVFWFAPSTFAAGGPT